MAALWIRTKYFPCCWSGCCGVSSGREKLCGRSIPRACSTVSPLNMGASLNECQIGFKHIADLMMEREIVIGGEESGGIGYSRYLPERDGILNSLLLANVLAEEKKPLGELVASLQKEYGRHFYGRRDLHIPDHIKFGAIERAKSESTNGSVNMA